MVLPLNGKSPAWGKNCYLAPSADLIGDVRLGDNCSVWFGVVLRGDVMPIEIGTGTNIQDGTIVHGTYKKCGARIGNNVSVGHRAMLHGCDIGDFTLIGMGATIMDQAKIGAHSIVAAGSLVTENSEFEEGVLILGRPAKVKRKLTEKELQFLQQSADNYQLYKSWYQTEGNQ